MAQNKKRIEQLEKEKLDEKIKGVLREQKKKKLKRNHTLIEEYSVEEEKRFKNTARKGGSTSLS